MRVPRGLCVVTLLAGLSGCSDSPVTPGTTTTTAPRAVATTTTMAADPDTLERTETPADTRPPRRARFRDRIPREPRIPRQTVRAHIAEALAKRRPDRPLTAGEIEQLTNKAMQIRVMKSRLARLGPQAQQTPRAAAMRGRLDVLLDEFQTRAGVLYGDVPAILDVPAPAARGE